MAYYVPVDEGQDESPLSAFEPSFGMSMKSSVQGTFNENASVLAYDAYKLNDANTSPYLTSRLSKADAEAQAKAAGVKVDAPDGGYSQEALDILIRRRQDQAARQAVDDRTPWGFGSVLRGSAQLLTGLVDPLNIASAFIPFVGEVRASRFIEAAGEGLFARASRRAVIGAAEGAGGAAVLEPMVYGAHAYLGDDYHMTDSLVNLAFGAAMGGVLHAGAGVLPDVRARVLKREIDRISAERIVSEASPDVREAAMRAAIADSVQGRVPDVVALISQGVEEARIEEFKRWAGNTQLVEADGRPTAFYHGVEAPERGESVPGGIHLTTDPQQANMFPGADSAPVMVRAEKIKDVPRIDDYAVQQAKGEGFDAIRSGDRVVVFNADQVRAYRADAFDARATHTDPIGELRAVRERQQGADALAVGSPEASRAAAERLETAPKDNGSDVAAEHLTDAMEQVQAVQRSLEASGMDPKRLERGAEALKAFDEGIADAKRIGKALEQYAQCGVMQ